jgi:hypothetical protein
MRRIIVEIDGPNMTIEAEGFKNKDCKTTIESLVKTLNVKKVDSKSKLTVNDIKVPVGVSLS